MIRGSAEFFDEDIDHASRIVLSPIPVFQAFRTKNVRALGPRSTPKRSASSDPPANRTRILSRKFKRGDAFLQ